jgi:hypothetical protein
MSIFLTTLARSASFFKSFDVKSSTKMAAEDAIISNNERKFILRALSENLRVDGRFFLEQRKASRSQRPPLCLPLIYRSLCRYPRRLTAVKARQAVKSYSATPGMAVFGVLWVSHHYSRSGCFAM